MRRLFLEQKIPGSMHGRIIKVLLISFTYLPTSLPHLVNCSQMVNDAAHEGKRMYLIKPTSFYVTTSYPVNVFYVTALLGESYCITSSSMAHVQAHVSQPIRMLATAD
jgi:hypothetical protein